MRDRANAPRNKAKHHDDGATKSESAKADLQKAWDAYLAEVATYQDQNNDPMARFAVIVEPNGVGGFDNTNLARIRTFREKRLNIERAAKRVIW
jgi:hypothetical protein